VLISDPYMHLQSYLIQNFVLLLENEISLNFKLKSVEGAPNGHQLTPLKHQAGAKQQQAGSSLCMHEPAGRYPNSILWMEIKLVKH